MASLSAGGSEPEMPQKMKMRHRKCPNEVDVPEGRFLAHLGTSLVELLVTLLLADAGSDPLLGVTVRHCRV
jgi:hypothetical protein